MKKTGRFIKRMLCICVAGAMVLSCSGCKEKTKNMTSIKYSDAEKKTISAEKSDQRLHLTDTEKLKFIATSGLISLYVDTDSYAVSIKESSKNKLWSSMPTKGNEKYDNSAAVVNLKVSHGVDNYYFNSQDNSVNFGTATYVVHDDSVTVKYIIAPDEKTAKAEKLNTTDIAFSVYVKYSLKDGNLFVTSGWENLSKNPNASICEMGILEFFGATDTAEEGDFMLVPDGCGGLINTGVEDSSFKPIEFSVYGEDNSNMAGTEMPGARLAVYGAKQGDSAFAVIVENGDAIATVHADRTTGTSGFNNVGVKFNITPVNDVSQNGDKSIRYVTAQSFGDELKMCYRFLNGYNASYSGMAIACREQLIRDKVITGKVVKPVEYLPFNVSVIGAAQKKLNKFSNIRKTVAVTTFEQAQDMVIQMKAKGLNNINLRYMGALSGGLDQQKISSAKFNEKLGGNRGFRELCSYMTAQNLNLFIDMNVLSTSTNESFSSKNSAIGINGEKTKKDCSFGINEFIGANDTKRELLAVSDVEGTVNKILKRFGDYKVAGFCVNDVGTLLYSDYSKNYINRQSAADIISKQLATLSSGRSIMIDSGNIRAIKNVDTVVNMPLSTAMEEGNAYVAVPFLQMILHGIVNYSGESINLAKNTKDAMLRCIEFGACPSYEWGYTEFDEKTEGKEKYFYGDWLAGSISFYEKANKALADLTDARMTKHEKIADGVFATQYDDSSLIYVNYNDKDVKVGSITVEAKGFLRIN